MNNKHYIRLDTNNYITKGFSDAFEEPLQADICINEEGGRQFELLEEINPPLFAPNRTHRYKYEDGAGRETTPEEQAEEYASFPVPTPQITMEERLAIAEDTINFLLGL